MQQSLRQPVEQFAASLNALAERWIGFSRPPVQRALAQSSWAADEREAYCMRCGDSVGTGEVTGSGCAACRKHRALAHNVVRLGQYAGPLREWILAVKYQRWSEMGVELGRLLGEQLRAAGDVDVERSIVAPMPMPWQRRLYRGIDHARVIAGAAARELGVPMICLLRRSNTTPQMAQPASVRLTSGGVGLGIRRRIGGWPLRDVHVIVVDDVRTTGATMRAAVRKLRLLRPRRITAAVLAVSDIAARSIRESDNY